jgi:hypothetical protein
LTFNELRGVISLEHNYLFHDFIVKVNLNWQTVLRIMRTRYGKQEINTIFTWIRMRNISNMSIEFNLYRENTMFIYCYRKVE